MQGNLISLFQGTELMSLSAAISHFLNCLLSSAQIIHPQQNLEEVRSLLLEDMNSFHLLCTFNYRNEGYQ